MELLFKILAAIGAVGGFIGAFPVIKNWFSKATLKNIVIDEDISVSSSRYGSIFKIKMGFLAEYNKVIISNIETLITSENGATKTLKWRYMEEYFGESEIKGTNLAQKNTKFQKVLALLVHTDFFMEKEIMFLDEDFRTKSNELIQKLREKTLYYSKTNKPISELNNEPEYIELLKIYESKYFYWGEGTFTANIAITLSNHTQFEKEIKFQILERDETILKTSIVSFGKYIESEFINPNIDISNAYFPTIYPTAKLIK